MKSEASRLPSRKWSIVALGSAGMATVFLSYLLAIAVALGCIALPYAMLVLVPIGGSGVVARILLSVFGVVAGFTILRSLIPQNEEFNVNGVRILLSQEPRLAKEIEAISTAMREPPPTEVYLTGDANAFVSETGGSLGGSKRRVMGLGLPLLQMLSIAQFRAVLAHEFGHYYAGDTRLGPWVYNTRKTLSRTYENLGKNSPILKVLRRWGVVYLAYSLLMGAMRTYWKIFMRITQAISRRQELRSDELACHIAGSQALIDGLENIRRCQPALNSYWNSVVFPVAVCGFQPALAEGFGRYMHAPQIEKATAEFLKEQSKVEKPSPFDTHPTLSKRVEKAREYNLSIPEIDDAGFDTALPMVSLIDGLPSLEAAMLKKYVPVLAEKELKPLDWSATGSEVYVPMWRKEVAPFQSALAGKTLADLPALAADPRPIAVLVPNPPKGALTDKQRTARAYDILFMAIALSLADNGWTVRSEPGTMRFERDGKKAEPGKWIGEIIAKKMTADGWAQLRAENGLGDWSLAFEPAFERVQ
jgi:heat shock protein HtpX